MDQTKKSVQFIEPHGFEFLLAQLLGIRILMSEQICGCRQSI
jgi:hypothetical protein